MRNFKRFLTLALAVLMVVSMFAFNTSAAAFTDIDADDEYLAKAVNLLNYIGVANGTSETTFSPDAPVTREQMAAFLYRLMNKGKSVNNGSNTSPFKDLTDPVFYFSVSWANSKGYVKGTSATTFDPKAGIKLQDAYTMVVRALGYETEETLPYPFGYIDVAEDKGVTLDEGLDSNLGYGDYLTRGDVAIILYNAFFAKTGVAETKQKETLIGTATNGATPQWVLETVTEYPVFCEKYFDVVEAEFKVVATPSYKFGTTATTKSFGYDAVHFSLVETEDKNVRSEYFVDFADLGVAGDVDDYIMSHFKMYITLDKDNDIDEILYAEPLMTKKTISKIGFETLTTNTPNSFFNTSDNESAKLLTGKVTLDGETAYFFNAPYAYATPSYLVDYNKTQAGLNAGIDNADKYLARNAKNLELISLALVSGSDDEYTYNYVTLADDTTASVNLFDTTLVDATFANGSTGIDDINYAPYAQAVANALKEAYVGGLYSADIYDVDGDGLYDYMNYKPYGFYFADTNAKKAMGFNTTDPEFGANNTYYVAKANVVGAELEDGDAFIGYINAAADMIEVAEIVEPVSAQITSKKSTGAIVLDNGETVSAATGWKLVSNAASLGAYTNALTNDRKVDEVKWAVTGLAANTNAVYEKDMVFYIYDGSILYQEGATAAVKFDGENVIILTNDIKGATTNQIFGTNWAANTGNTTYAYAWVDGEEKYVPVEVDADDTDIYPEIGGVANGATSHATYEDKLATYTVDKDGVYTLTLLGNAWKVAPTNRYVLDVATSKYVANEDYIGLAWLEDAYAVDLTKEDATAQAYQEFAGTLYLNKYAKNRFVLSTGNTSTSASVTYTATKADQSTATVALPDLLITEDTVVIIRNEYDKDDRTNANADGATGNDTVDFAVLKAEDLTDSVANTLSNVQLVLQNNTKYSDREELVILYAETTDNKKLNLASSRQAKDNRIVKSVEVEYVDEEYVANYTVYNPYTGATENIYGAKTGGSTFSAPFAAGDIVKVESGKIADETVAGKIGTFTTTAAAPALAPASMGLFWVVGYDAEAGAIEVVSYDTAAASNVNSLTSGQDEDDVVYATFAKNAIYRIGVDAATVTALKKTGAWEYNTSMAVASADVLAGDDEAYLAYNSSYLPKSVTDPEYTTVYGNYPKVFLNIDVANNGTFGSANVDTDTDLHGEVDYVVVVVNNNEGVEYCAVKDI